MREALHAEWTKLRTVPGTIWLLLAVITAPGYGARLWRPAMAPGYGARL